MMEIFFETVRFIVIIGSMIDIMWGLHVPSVLCRLHCDYMGLKATYSTLCYAFYFILLYLKKVLI